MSQIKLSILIPVRNEGINIGIMLKILRAVLDFPHEILVIYDSPEDNTVPVVKNLRDSLANVKLVFNSLGKGVINAVRSGVKVSQGEYILIFAADEVGPVLAIEDMVSLLDEGCDLVSCTRYAYGGRRLGGSALGGFLSQLANKLFSIVACCALSDATTGIKMFKRNVFEQIVLESRPIGWAFIFELAIKSQQAGMKLGEVPIISIDRLYGGESSFRLGPWVKEYMRWFIWGMKHMPRSKKEKAQVRIPKTTAY
ncbi:MAG: glycosyltransferase [Candidatus Omnitrophota bacterium]|nr:glycosyltransferase [Candidatus Omnitrophota bacterium]